MVLRKKHPATTSHCLKMASMWRSVTYVVLITGLFSLTESQEDGEELPRIGMASMFQF